MSIVFYYNVYSYFTPCIKKTDNKISIIKKVIISLRLGLKYNRPIQYPLEHKISAVMYILNVIQHSMRHAVNLWKFFYWGQYRQPLKPRAKLSNLSMTCFL